LRTKLEKIGSDYFIGYDENLHRSTFIANDNARELEFCTCLRIFGGVYQILKQVEGTNKSMCAADTFPWSRADLASLLLTCISAERWNGDSAQETETMTVSNFGMQCQQWWCLMSRVGVAAAARTSVAERSPFHGSHTLLEGGLGPMRPIVTCPHNCWSGLPHQH